MIVSVKKGLWHLPARLVVVCNPPLPHRWLRQKRAVRFEQLNIVAGLSLIPLSSASTRTSKRHPFAVRLPTILAPLHSVLFLVYFTDLTTSPFRPLASHRSFFFNRERAARSEYSRHQHSCCWHLSL